MQRLTIGRLLVEQALPPKYRRDGMVLDSKGLRSLFTEILQQDPDSYADISHKLHQVAREVAYRSGGTSFGPQHLRSAAATNAARQRLLTRLATVLASTDTASREKDIVSAVDEEAGKLTGSVYDESLRENNPFARQIMSGGRGNPANLRSLRGFDGLYQDHQGNTVPVPILRNYSEGLGFEEYLAATYGSRQGAVQAKLSTADAGYLLKQLINASHRLIVSKLDDDQDREDNGYRGLPVPTDDTDSIGSLLAADIGPFKRNTPITANMLRALRQSNVDEILVRSPLVGGPPDGSLYARDVGVWLRGRLPPRGTYVGHATGQALGEPITQMQLSSKHSAGIRGNVPVGFPIINQITQAPAKYPYGAAHAEIDGRVTAITAAPQGGVYVSVGDKQHHVGPDSTVTVKIGDTVEAGDTLSDGLPNPRMLVEHKGLGEGRRRFVSLLRDAYAAAGHKADRRNLEAVARGLLNHVKITDFYEDYLPGDTVHYNLLETSWRPREDAKLLRPAQAVGKYLEQPVLHYTVGTRLQPSMLSQMQRWKVDQVHVHDSPPPWQPIMLRAETTAAHDPDWMSRMLGPGHQKSLLSGVQRGDVSDPRGSSYVPAFVEGITLNDGPSAGWTTDWPDEDED